MLDSEPGRAQGLLRRCRQVPLWLRRHGLEVTLRKLEEEGLQNKDPNAQWLLRTLEDLDPSDPLKLQSSAIAQDGMIYILTSREVRRRAEAVALAATLVIKEAGRA